MELLNEKFGLQGFLRSNSLVEPAFSTFILCSNYNIIDWSLVLRLLPLHFFRCCTLVRDIFHATFIQIITKNFKSGLPARGRFQLIGVATACLISLFVFFLLSSVGLCSSNIQCCYCSANDYTVHPEFRGGYLAFTLQVLCSFSPDYRQSCS